MLWKSLRLCKWSSTNSGSIHLLNCWATSVSTSTTIETTAWHAALWHATTTCCLIDFHHDRVDHTLKFLLLGLEFILLRQLVLVQPIQSFLHSLFDLVLVISLELVFQLLFLQGVAHCEAIVLQSILCLNLRLVLLIFLAVLLCFLDHP